MEAIKSMNQMKLENFEFRMRKNVMRNDYEKNKRIL